MKTKVCKCCGQELPVTEFNHYKRSPDGLYRLCRTCWNKKQQEYKTKRAAAKLDIELSPEEIEVIPIIEKKSANQSVSTVNIERPSLAKVPNFALIQELKGRGVTVLVDPKPRDLISRLKEFGYVGTLEYYEKRTIDLKSFV